MGFLSYVAPALGIAKRAGTKERTTDVDDDWLDDFDDGPDDCDDDWADDLEDLFEDADEVSDGILG